MSKLHCPWKFVLQVGDKRMPLYMHNEEDLMGGEGHEPHSLLLSTDVPETEWSGALNDAERLDMLNARLDTNDEERPLFSIRPGEAIYAQLFVTGPSVHNAEFSAHEEQPVGAPVRFVCSKFIDADTNTFDVKSRAAMHELGFAPLTLTAATDVDGHVKAVDAFLYPQRIREGMPARMLIDAFHVHNIIAACVEADAVLDGDSSEMAMLPADARIGGAMRGAMRGVRKAGGAAKRGIKKVGTAARAGAKRAGAKVKSAATRIKGGARKLGGKVRATGSAGIMKARGGLQKFKSGGSLRTRLGNKITSAKTKVGQRVKSLRQNASGKFSSLRQKISSRKQGGQGQSSRIKNLMSKLRGKGKGQQSGSSSKGGAGAAAGGAAASDPGAPTGTDAAAMGGGGGGGVAPLDVPLEDPAVAGAPAPPLPAQPLSLNQAQETMLQSAVEDGLVAPEQLASIRASGVSAATVAGIPPTVVSALVTRDPRLQQAVVSQVQRNDPERLMAYRRSAVAPLQMTLEERENFMLNGIAPARMILPSAPELADLDYAPAYVPGRVNAAARQPDIDEDGGDEEAPAAKREPVPSTQDESPVMYDDGSVSLPRDVLDFFIEGARQHRQLLHKMIDFTPEPDAGTVRLQPDQLERLLKLADDLERQQADAKKPDPEPKADDDNEAEPKEEDEGDDEGGGDERDDDGAEEPEGGNDEAAATEPDKEAVSDEEAERKRQMEAEMKMESQDAGQCLDAFAALVGLSADDELDAAAGSDDADALHSELPDFVNAHDNVPLSALLICAPHEGRTPGVAGAMEFAYHLVAPKGEFVDTKLYHAMEAAGDLDTLFAPTTTMDYEELGNHVTRLAAAVSRQIHNPPSVCPAHGAHCQAH